MKTWKSIFKSKQVRKECLYSFLILMGIRLLATIPTPGTHPDYFKTLIHDNSALTFINAMTGNGLSGMSIMALSITPYITASIMVQLAGVIYPHIHEMEKGMEDERKRIHIITLVLGGFVALMESSMIAISFGKKGLLVSAKWYWILLVMLIWTAGSVVASLAGELIRKKYDFNGSSLILLFNILASYPSDALSVYQTMISEKQIAYKVISSILIVLFVIALFAYTVCLQAAERRIPITHSQKIKGASMKSTLPLKACPGTVVPIIFASSILTFPSMIAAFIGKENLTALKFLNTSYWFQKENFYYSIGAIFYIAMIIGFSFYYAEIIFNPTEVAMDLKKKGANVYSIRPGKETAAYLHKKSNEVVLIGAVGLCVIAMVPAVLSGIWHLSGIAFLGTSIVITVGVSLEFRTQCIAKSQNGKYSSMVGKRRNFLMKKPEFKKGKKLAAILQKMYFPKGKELFFDTLYVLLFCIVLSAFLFGFHEGITFIFRVLF